LKKIKNNTELKIIEDLIMRTHGQKFDKYFSLVKAARKIKENSLIFRH
jgi:hypothetical protein